MLAASTGPSARVAYRDRFQEFIETGHVHLETTRSCCEQEGIHGHRRRGILQILAHEFGGLASPRGKSARLRKPRPAVTGKLAARCAGQAVAARRETANA